MINEKGLPGYFPQLEVKVPNDAFENFIRAYGITAAAEWFDHRSDSEFVESTIECFEYLNGVK